MSQAPILHSLQQAWLHAHEEDSPGQTVYRPASYDFPPARGRAGFELLPGQRLRYTGIAPADGPSHANGYWQLRQETPLAVLLLSLPKQPDRRLSIISISADRLVVKS
jgi:hypothetical protein